MPDGIADGDFRFPAGRIRFGRESDFAARRFGDRPADVSAASVAISGFFLLFPVRYPASFAAVAPLVAACAPPCRPSVPDGGDPDSVNNRILVPRRALFPFSSVLCVMLPLQAHGRTLLCSFRLSKLCPEVGASAVSANL